MSLRPLLVSTVMAAVVAAACTVDGSVSDDEPAVAPVIDDEDQAPDTALTGARLEVVGVPTRSEQEAIRAVIDAEVNEPFGADVTYTGSGGFEQEIQERIATGDPPDVALYPQPGAVIEQAAAGNLVALEDLGFDIAALEETFGADLLRLGAYDGRHYGLPTNVSLKSLVWYHLPTFEERGYEVPETWEELLALSERIVADGGTPWCIGSGADGATGWVITDWLEDIVLRDAGVEVYDRWVRGEVPFDDPAILAAAQRLAQITHTDGFVLGGTDAIPDIDYRDAPGPLFDDPPGCLLHRQASFIVSFFPHGVIGTDIEVFPFPAIGGDDGALIAGELAVAFSDRPEVGAFLEVFSGRDAQCAQGSFAGVSRISPNMDTSADCYDDPVVALSAETVLSALEQGTARFDASDLMPSAVGAGTFWSGMNDWMRGAELEEVLTEIADSWPE
ncbi:MAG: ABC transporter substrate-binding protein [Nitriliruptoraceae bacterium]